LVFLTYLDLGKLEGVLLEGLLRKFFVYSADLHDAVCPTMGDAAVCRVVALRGSSTFSNISESIKTPRFSWTETVFDV
jgi:hypothetical protein